LKKPLEFFKLFKHFSSVNDPQIKSDMMSILMCLNFEDYSRTILKVSADWVIRNVLAPEKRDSNRNVAIRYFSISILREAIREGLVREEVAKPYLPPFQSLNFSIPMNRNASEKATTDGYGGFDYDLCRYVLCDSITNRFDLFSSVSQKEITSFLEQVQKQQDNFPVLSPNRFILSAAYQFVLLNGWKKEDGERKGDLAGVDSCILRYYREEDHGSQSPVMSIHEKYIWQAREEILGFLSDHLPVSSDQVAKYVTDYGEIESFVIPSEERLFVPSQEAPLLMPETYASFGQNVAANKDEVVKTIFDFPGVDWKGLLFRDNHVRECELLGNELMSIYAYSSFGDDQNMQTTLFVISLILDQSNLGKLLEIFQSKAEDKTANSIDLEALKGGVVCNCYVSPYEICWCPWKERFESWKLNDLFPDINLVSAVDGCVSNLPNVGDIFWELPSKCLRDLLSIEFFDGQFFRAKDFTPEILLEKRSDINGNNQSMLLGNKDQILSLLSKKEQTMVFLMKEQRTPSPLSQERFGSFFARKNILSIGYFSGGNFHVKKISEVQNEN
jgi:hypothetical protein